ncbi:hypothetical protein ACFU7Y_33210 [Kitasatospora sp. NPDC057542]|uniref:hypothetical protein n=1 Tax=Streptomycetaceae TaxID=2062 RepID=UPI001CCFAE93|nr:hypothetical protein [Streptomyces sp. LS1784]
MARIATHHTAPAADHKPVLIAIPIVATDPYAGPVGRRHHTCASCESSRTGGEAACWSCGRPVTGEHPNTTAVLQMPLHRPASHPA